MSGWRLPWPAAAAAATLAVHAAVAVWNVLPGTFRKYNAAAELYLASDLPAERLVDFSPGYLHLAVVFERLFGHSEAVLEGLQIVLTAAAAGFLAALLARRFSRGLAIATVAAFAVDRHVLVYERVLEPEALLLFCVLGWIFLLERDAVSPGLAGCLAAAALLVRPTFLPVYLLVPLHLRLHDAAAWRRRTVRFAVPVAAALAVLAVRSFLATGDFRTPVMNPGTVFYEGTNPLSHGTSAVYPPLVLEMVGGGEPDVAHVRYRTLARAATGEDLSVAEVNSYWSGLALSYVRAEPGRYVRLLGEKLQRAFHGYRWHDVDTAWLYDRTLRTPSVPFALVAALALVGLAVEARRWEGALLFYLIAGAQLSVMLVFYVSARQRLVLLPALYYFAAAAVEAFFRDRRRGVLGAVLVVLLALGFTLPNDLIRDDLYRRSATATGTAAFDELRELTRDEPVAWHAERAVTALAFTPWVEWTPAFLPQDERTTDEQLAERLAAAEPVGIPEAFDHAVAFYRAGRLARAEELLVELAEADAEVYRGAAGPSDPRFYLARTVLRRGDRARAVALLEEALARSPGDPYVAAELYVLTGEARYEEVLRGGTGALDVRYLVGKALFVHGRSREAAAAFAEVVAKLSRWRTGRIHLAAALGAEGRIDEGAEHYLEAMRQAQDPLFLSREISELFRRWAALHPEDARTQVFAARVLHENGRLREASALLEELETDEPGLKERIEEERRRLRLALGSRSP